MTTASRPAWRALTRVHTLIGILAFIAGASVTVVATLHAAVTQSELEHAVAPVRAVETAHEQRLTRMETSLDWLEKTLYRTGLQVGAPVSPPPVHPADAGVP